MAKNNPSFDNMSCVFVEHWLWLCVKHIAVSIEIIWICYQEKFLGLMKIEMMIKYDWKPLKFFSFVCLLNEIQYFFPQGSCYLITALLKYFFLQNYQFLDQCAPLCKVNKSRKILSQTEQNDTIRIKNIITRRQAAIKD